MTFLLHILYYLSIFIKHVVASIVAIEVWLIVVHSRQHPHMMIMVRSSLCHGEIAHFKDSLLVCLFCLVYTTCTITNMLCRVGQIRR